MKFTVTIGDYAERELRDKFGTVEAVQEYLSKYLESNEDDLVQTAVGGDPGRFGTRCIFCEHYMFHTKEQCTNIIRFDYSESEDSDTELQPDPEIKNWYGDMFHLR